MDPVSLIAIAATYAGAAVAQKCAERSVEEGWNVIGVYLTDYFGMSSGKKLIKAKDYGVPAIEVSDAAKNLDVLEQAQRIYSLTPALRRAALIPSVLRHARVLWVDDNPENNEYERENLRSLGVHTDSVTSTEAGIKALSEEVYDLVVSDMSRDGKSGAGMRLVEQIELRGFPQRTIFYVGFADPRRGTPLGAFGITHRPDELLNLIMDVLERQRV